MAAVEDGESITAEQGADICHLVRRVADERMGCETLHLEALEGRMQAKVRRICYVFVIQVACAAGLLAALSFCISRQ